MSFELLERRLDLAASAAEIAGGSVDVVYASERGRLRFRRVKAPDKAELESLVQP